jgi:small subunit ribosomal protein S16
MPATIRLQRVGRKKQASFRIVVIEKTAARGAPALEILGIYNPRTTPSSIRFDAARALYWLHAGALPSHSVESIFRKTGVMKQFRSGVEPESLTETLITVGAPAGGGKTSQRGVHGPRPAAKEAADATPAAAAPAETEEPVAEAEKAEGDAEAGEAEEVTAEAQSEEAVDEAVVEAEKAAEDEEAEEAEEVTAEAESEEAVAEAEVDEVAAEAEVDEVAAEAEVDEVAAEAEKAVEDEEAGEAEEETKDS